MTSSDISIEFIVQETNLQQSPPQSPKNKLTQALYRNVSFRALSFVQQDDSPELIMNLQTVLKSEYLLLQYEQKRKINRIKQIQYAYTQAFKRFLWSRPKIQVKTQIIANQKDLLNIHENLVEQIQTLNQKILDLKNLGEIVDFKTNPQYSFIRDFNNFFPNWYENISSIIECQVKRCQSIDHVFQSQYTFASKILESIRQNWQVQQYCIKIFQPILEKIANLKNQLTIDFGIAYQEHETIVNKKGYLKNFLNNGGVITSQIKQQIAKLIGQDNSMYLETWLIQMEIFAKDNKKFLLLLEEIGQQQADVGELKPRLCFLVFKKIVKNRKTLEDIICLLINQIVQNISKFPKQIKFVMEKWYSACTQRFQQVKTHDIKAFFGKHIFSKILFTQFLSIIQENKEISKRIKQRSMETIALIAQKMMFGQQFLQKNKYGYFESIICYYNKTIQQFIQNLVIKSRKTIIPKKKVVDVYLISLETLKFLYQIIQKHEKNSQQQIKQYFKLKKFEEKIICNCDHQIGSERYKASHIFLALIDRPKDNYTHVFKPKDKRKRALIQFLIMIERISEPTSFIAILQQYKNQQNSSCSLPHKIQISMLGAKSQHQKPSLQIYANYLQNLIKSSCKQIIQQILNSIQKVQKRAKQIKLSLEKQHNFAQNLKKYFQNAHQQNRKKKSYNNTKRLIKQYMKEKCGIVYEIIDQKVCQISPNSTTTEKTIQACLDDIALYWRMNYQGYDALYQHIIERIKQNIENSGIVDENMLEAAHNIIGAKLYQILKLNEYQTQIDIKIQEQKLKHEFVTIQIMQLPNLIQQQELILSQTKAIFKKMQKPQSPQDLLHLFHDITLVFQNVVLIKGKASDINADLQIPLMIFVILHNEVRNLHSIMNFIEKFVDEDQKNTAYGQSHTLVKSALFIVEQMDAQKLNLPEQKYIKLLEIQEERRMKIKKQISKVSQSESSPQRSSQIEFQLDGIILVSSENTIEQIDESEKIIYEDLHQQQQSKK